MMNRRSLGKAKAGSSSLMRAAVVASLGVAACHAPGSGIFSVAQGAPRFEGLPVRIATPRSVALTLYPDDWALVSDTVAVRLEAGEQVVSLSPVPSQVEARGAYLQIPATVSDKRYRYDLQTRERLMERYHGKRVEIVTATGSIQATLIMTDSGAMYRIGDRLTSEPGGRVVFPPMADLAIEPTLEWIVRANAPWSGTATASFVVNRLGWENEYTLRTDATQSRGEWIQWAAIRNHSGGRFDNARVTLIAGDVRRDSRPPMDHGGVRAYRMETAPESYAARYQYRLPEPLTLERNTEPRVTLVRADSVPITRTFQVVSAVNLYRTVEPELPRKAQIRLTIPNTTAANLGKPLPRGKVTVYTPNRQGEPQIAGEPVIPDTPQGQYILLNLGEAFDLTVERKQSSYALANDGARVAYAITLRNQMDQTATVEVIEQIPGEWSVLSHSLPYERTSASSLRFQPSVPAGGSITLSYEVRVRTPDMARPTTPAP